MKYTPLPDGTLRFDHSPIEDMPFYSDWLAVLLSRRAAFDAPSLKKHDIDPETGFPRRVIIPYDANQEQACIINADGSTSVICIGCATETPYQQIVNISRTKRRDTGFRLSSNGKIRIGGVVQFSEDETANERHGSTIISAIRRWKPRSVARMGFGCPACVELFMAEQGRVAEENHQKEMLYKAFASVYTKRGDIEKLAKLKQPKLFSAWLDVFRQEIMLISSPRHRSGRFSVRRML